MAANAGRFATMGTEALKFIRANKLLVGATAATTVAATGYNIHKGNQRGLKGGAAVANAVLGSPMLNHIETAAQQKKGSVIKDAPAADEVILRRRSSGN